jgi:phage gp37-like protein
MPKFRKKPTTFEAQQLTQDAMEEVREWCGGTFATSGYTMEVVGLNIRTASCVIPAEWDDWIIRNPVNDPPAFWVMSPDEFEAMYEQVPDE